MTTQTALTEIELASGSFCWNELLTIDTNASSDFYTNLFAWTKDAGPDPENSDYSVFTDNGMPKCGMMAMHWEGKPNWLGYVNVENVDEMTAKAESLGAHVCAPPSDIPNIGRFSVVTDPTGGTIGLFLSITGCPAGSFQCPEQSIG